MPLFLAVVYLSGAIGTATTMHSRVTSDGSLAPAEPVEHIVFVGAVVGWPVTMIIILQAREARDQ